MDEEDNAAVHTPENPYCGDLTCWCHSDADYHAEVLSAEPTREEVEIAYLFFELPFVEKEDDE